VQEYANLLHVSLFCRFALLLFGDVDRWCHFRILRLSYLQRVASEEVVRRTVTIPPAMQVIRNAVLL